MGDVIRRHRTSSLMGGRAASTASLVTDGWFGPRVQLAECAATILDQNQ
jgi:hypothetical protein